MEIILLENIINLGNIGDKVKVKPGYGRNYLLKQGKALRFNKEIKENGELYGSIKPKEISTKIYESIKVEIKPSQIVLKNDLNKIGIYKIDINFHSEVSAKISIKIDKIQSA